MYSFKQNLPLLLYTKSPNSFPPKNNFDELKNIMQQIAFRNLFLEEELLTIIKNLASVSVPVLLLKGVHLNQTLYPPGIRFMGDIDLLIKPEDFHRAHKVIQELGFYPWLENFPLWVHLHFSKKLTYNRSQTPDIPLDLHFSLGPYPYLGRLDTAALWAKAHTINIKSYTVYVLCPEHLLIHLCLHLFQHIDEDEQSSACDAAVLLRQENNHFPWNNFIAEVREAGIHQPVSLALKTIHENYETTIPQSVFTQLEALPASAINNLVFRHSKEIKNQRKKHLLQFLTTPGLFPRLRCLPCMLFNVIHSLIKIRR